jgi:hypothetical protein
LLNIIANINRRLAHWEESKSKNCLFCSGTDKFIKKCGHVLHFSNKLMHREE